MDLDSSEIVLLNDTYTIGKNGLIVQVVKSEKYFYPKAETGARFQGNILNGKSVDKRDRQMFKVSDIVRRFDCTLEEFSMKYPEYII